MQVAAVKPKGDAARGAGQHCPLFAHIPLSSQSPSIEALPHGRAVGPLRVPHNLPGRVEMLGAAIADVRLLRLYVPTRRYFDSAGRYQRGVDRPDCSSVLLQERPYNPFEFGIVAFTETVCGDSSFAVDEIKSRPVFIVELSP